MDGEEIKEGLSGVFFVFVIVVDDGNRDDWGNFKVIFIRMVENDSVCVVGKCF